MMPLHAHCWLLLLASSLDCVALAEDVGSEEALMDVEVTLLQRKLNMPVGEVEKVTVAAAKQPNVTAQVRQGYRVVSLKLYMSLQTLACVGATILAVCVCGAIVWYLAPGASTAELSDGRAKDEDATTRLHLLDNAKAFAMLFVVYSHFVQPVAYHSVVDAKTWLAGADYLSMPLLCAIRMLHMPMFSFISGICSQSPPTKQTLIKFLTALVAPTLLWTFFGAPVIYHALKPGQLHTLWPNVGQFVSLHTLSTGGGYNWPWYLVALIAWRSIVYILWAHLHPSFALASAMFISCIGGYWELSFTLASQLRFSSWIGYFPYFALGYIFPLERALQKFSRPTSFARIRNAVFVLIWIVLVVAPNSFALPLPDPHENYSWYSSHFHMVGWDYNLLWTYRVAKVFVDMVTCGSLLLFVIPDTETFFTWIGRYTLYVYLCHALFWDWRIWLLSKLSLPVCTSLLIHVAVFTLHFALSALALCFFAGRPWRWLWVWCLEPTWTDGAARRMLQGGGARAPPPGAAPAKFEAAPTKEQLWAAPAEGLLKAKAPAKKEGVERFDLTACDSEKERSPRDDGLERVD